MALGFRVKAALVKLSTFDLNCFPIIFVSPLSCLERTQDSLDVALEEVEHAMLDPRTPVLVENQLPSFVVFRVGNG